MPYYSMGPLGSGQPGPMRFCPIDSKARLRSPIELIGGPGEASPGGVGGGGDSWSGFLQLSHFVVSTRPFCLLSRPLWPVPVGWIDPTRPLDAQPLQLPPVALASPRTLLSEQLILSFPGSPLPQVPHLLLAGSLESNLGRISLCSPIE